MLTVPLAAHRANAQAIESPDPGWQHDAQMPSPAADFERAQPTRHQPVVRERTFWPVLGTGIGLLAWGWVGYWAAYTFGVSILFHSDNPDFGSQLPYSYIPLAGPWINIATHNAEPVFPTIMGLLQASGLILFIVGLTVPERIEVPRFDVAVAPTEGGLYAGLTIRD